MRPIKLIRDRLWDDANLEHLALIEREDEWGDTTQDPYLYPVEDPTEDTIRVAGERYSRKDGMIVSSSRLRRASPAYVLARDHYTAHILADIRYQLDNGPPLDYDRALKIHRLMPRKYQRIAWQPPKEPPR